MSSLKLVAGMVLLPVLGLSGGAALAGSSDFCLTGTVNANAQSVNCASRWVAANGQQLGQVADPRNTPKTPYNGSRSVWSNTTSNNQVLLGGSVRSTSSHSTGGAPVWTSQPPAVARTSSHHTAKRSAHSTHHRAGTFAAGEPTILQHVPTAHVGQVLVTRGAGHNTLYDGHWGQGYGATGHAAPRHPAPAPYVAPVISQGTYFSGYSGGYSTQGAHHSYSSGRSNCFTLGPNGQNISVTCPVASTHTQSWTQPSTSYPVSIVQHASASASASVATATANNFYSTLNGGVGSGAMIYSGGGGGGAFVSSGSSSVFGRSPIIRMRSHNKGKGKKMHGHKKGCGMCGGGGMMGGGD